MSDEYPAAPPAAAAEPVERGALGAWWRQGARSAFLLKPDWRGLQATPGVIAALVLVELLLGIGLERLYIVGPAFFYWPALHTGWVSTLVAAWACWLLIAQPQDPSRSDGPASAVALFAMMAAQGLTFIVVLGLVFVPLARNGPELAGEWSRAAWIAGLVLPALWMGTAQLALVWRSGLPRHAPRAVASLLLCASLAVNTWFDTVRHWYPTRGDQSAEAAVRPLKLTQESMELQARILADKLQAIAPERPGVIDLYAVTFAPYADEDVFKRESQLVASVMQERFDAKGRTLQLVNHRDTIREWPWATPLNLQRAIRRIAERMNRDEDLIFIHLTSHGAREGSLSAEFLPLEIDALTPQMLKRWLDEAGIRHRVISVSACFSGSWIEPLGDPGTLVMTAADSSHTSYGCGRGSQLTYFGRAMFDEQLRHTWSFEQAHAAARSMIDKREREAGKSDGFSNPQIAVGAEVRKTLARFEAERAAARQAP
jgi:hypothetical protein